MLSAPVVARIDLMIPGLRSEARARRMVVAAMLVSTVLAVVAAVPFWLVDGPIGALDPQAVRFVLPIGLVLAAAQAVLAAKLIRSAMLEQIAASRVAQGVTRPVVQLAAAPAGLSAVGLYAGAILGQVAACTMLLRRDFTRNSVRLPSVKWSMRYLRRSLRFIIVGILGAVVNGLTAFALLAALSISVERS
ncbi:MAG TPA: hypothetical protein PLL69_12980, partial [Gemmatimonadales bacterium]|nr:hypothetical protein [Gemmatimonadales bacterium]